MDSERRFWASRVAENLGKKKMFKRKDPQKEKSLNLHVNSSQILD